LPDAFVSNTRKSLFILPPLAVAAAAIDLAARKRTEVQRCGIWH
jgi:hypothetical protein